MIEGWETRPGETPIDDISGLIPRATVRTRPDLDIVEAENILLAVSKYQLDVPSDEVAPFTMDWCIKLHGEMFGEVWEWAGCLRTCDLTIGKPHAQLQFRLRDMVEDLLAWKAAYPRDFSLQAALLHHRAVEIHPFLNGNGRWSRLLANIWLRKHGQPIAQWPDKALGAVSTIRDEYIAAVKAADKGNIDLLVELHQRHAQNAPEDS